MHTFVVEQKRQIKLINDLLAPKTGARIVSVIERDQYGKRGLNIRDKWEARLKARRAAHQAAILAFES